MADRKPFVISGRTGDWEVVMGLEVHAQVASNSKLFSGASTAFGSDPNSNVSLVDAAMPGMLPVINEECVAQAVRTGLGLKAKINLKSTFDRKNYFYPDLPQGYQISQYELPVVQGGTLTIRVGDGQGNDSRAYEKVVRLTRAHLEEDAGKSIHDDAIAGGADSAIDLNRGEIDWQVPLGELPELTAKGVPPTIGSRVPSGMLHRRRTGSSTPIPQATTCRLPKASDIAQSPSR